MPRSSLFRRSIRQFHRCFWLLICSSLLFIFSVLLTSMQAQAATKHGCASATPQPIAGATVPVATPGSILINEVLNNPASTWNCSEPSGSFSLSNDSWVELFNPQNQTIDLYAVHAEISLDGGSNWYTLPQGSDIAARGFFVVFPIENSLQQPASNAVILVFGGEAIDQIHVPPLQPDQSLARIPDGSASWQLIGKPTIGASNNPSPITATATKTPRPTRSPSGTKTGNIKGDDGGNESTPVNSGTQTRWSGLQLPDGNATLAVTPIQTLTPNSQLPTTLSQNSGINSGLLLLLLALAILLASALIYCWRIFRAP